MEFSLQRKVFFCDLNYSIVIEGKNFPITEFVFSGKESFDWLKLIGSDQVSQIDLSTKKLFIAKNHCPICFSALSKTGERSLKNILLKKAENKIEVHYEG